MRFNFFVIACVVLCGCPLESKYPISDPENARVPNELLGIWHCPIANEEPARMKIVKFNDHEFLFETYEEDQSISLARGFVSEIKDTTFINYQELGASLSEPFGFAIYNVDKSWTLSIRAVEDTLFPTRFKSSKALRKALRKNLDDPELSEELTRCTPELLRKLDSPNSILEAAQISPPGNIVSMLHVDPNNWEAVLSQISLGGREWLRVAAALAPGTDATASLELKYAVAGAIPKNPLGVIRMLDRTFTPEDICTSPFTEPEPGVAGKFNSEAIEALSTLETDRFDDARLRCLEKLQR